MKTNETKTDNAKTNKAEKKNKTTVFHLIILDESGSMTPLWEATIQGCNETIRGAQAQQKEFGENQRTFVSIYAFQSGANVPSRYLLKNVSADQVEPINKKLYHPWGNTPLYDAIGSALIDLEAVVSTHEDAHGIITIITDGYENASTHYSAPDLAKIIDRLKELGWVINFIGAGIDVKGEASNLHINQSGAFSIDANEASVKDFYANLNNQMFHEARNRFVEEASVESVEERRKMRKGRGLNFWKK